MDNYVRCLIKGRNPYSSHCSHLPALSTSFTHFLIKTRPIEIRGCVHSSQCWHGKVMIENLDSRIERCQGMSYSLHQKTHPSHPVHGVLGGLEPVPADIGYLVVTNYPDQKITKLQIYVPIIQQIMWLLAWYRKWPNIPWIQRVYHLLLQTLQTWCASKHKAKPESGDFSRTLMLPECFLLK